MTITAEERAMDDGAAGLDDAALRRYNELDTLRRLAQVVRDDLVPIVEMSDEANNPSEDLYVVMVITKELLAGLPNGADMARAIAQVRRETVEACIRAANSGPQECTTGCHARLQDLLFTRPDGSKS